MIDVKNNNNIGFQSDIKFQKLCNRYEHTPHGHALKKVH